MKFQAGDVVYHKATRKRGVVTGYHDGKVSVTTQDSEYRYYLEEELYTEKEYDDRF
jgi:hypothetical protein